MSITAADVNKLRQMTGAGMMDCKKALTEANGDFEAAIDVLRKQGQKVAAKRADRDASEGAVIATTNADHTRGVIVSLNCETDFVAKNEGFVDMAKKMASLAIASFPATKEELLALSYEGSLTIGLHPCRKQAGYPGGDQRRRGRDGQGRGHAGCCHEPRWFGPQLGCFGRDRARA